MNHFVLHAAPEALHRRIVVTVSLARHGSLHAELRNQFAVIICTVLRAAVGVVNQARRWSLAAHRTPQSLRRQILRHSRPHRIPHQFAGEDVLYACEIKPSFICHDVGNVGDPHFIRSCRLEGLVQQIVRHWKSVARIRGGLEPALLLTAQAELLPQSDDPVPPCTEALGGQLWLQPQWPIRLAGLNMSSLDRDLQSLIILRALRWRTIVRCVEPAARYVEDAAQQAKRVIESHRFYERVPGSDSLAKYAVAFFSTSFSMRSTASSLRSFATSASSSDTLRLPGGVVGSVPRLAAATQFASVPFGMAIRLAASSSVRP